MVTRAELQDLMTTGLKTWFHDCFLSSEMLDTSVTQTAAVYLGNSRLMLETGVQQDSEARANYLRAFYNPRYASLRLKLRMDDYEDVFAFWGFKSTLSAPSWGMTESHAGFMLYHGTLYFSTGNGAVLSPTCQVTPITDIDPSNWLTYELAYNSARWYSLPYTVPFFDVNVLPGLKQGLTRKWSQKYVNGVSLPSDEMHYIVLYATNTTGSSRYIECQSIDYQEVYPD